MRHTISGRPVQLDVFIPQLNLAFEYQVKCRLLWVLRFRVNTTTETSMHLEKYKCKVGEMMRSGKHANRYIYRLLDATFEHVPILFR